MMNSIGHYYFHLLRRHLISWRMLAVLMVTVLTIDAFMMPVRDYCQKMEVKMSPWGFAIFWNNKYIVLCFLLIFAFAAAIFPEDRAKERYIITRIGVSKWVSGQALFLITFSWLYTFFMYLCFNLLLLNVMEFIPNWGQGWGTMTNSDVIAAYDIYITVPYLVISNYEPVYANLLVVLIMGLLLGMMSMLMLWLNFYSKIMGPIMITAVIFLDMAAKKSAQLIKYSPVSWLRLDMHYRITKTDQPTVWYIVMMLILLTLLFWLLTRVTANRTQENGKSRN